MKINIVSLGMSLPLLLGAALSGCAQTESKSVALDAGEWRVEQIDGVALVIAADEDRRPTLQFTAAEQRAGGSGGCNRYSGSYTETGDALSFGPMMQTKMGCADPIGRIEREFHTALGKVAARRVNGDQLELLDASGVVVIGLRSTP